MVYNMKKTILLVLLFTVFSCKNNEEVKPIVQDIKELVFASGELEWDNVYNLTAQTDGVLTNVNFEIGNKINKGTIIAKIDNKSNYINSQSAKEQLVISNENITSNAPALQQLQENIQFAESIFLTLG